METLITAEDVKSGLSLIGSEGLTCDELAPHPWGSGGNRSVAKQPEYGTLWHHADKKPFFTITCANINRLFPSCLLSCLLKMSLICI